MFHLIDLQLSERLFLNTFLLLIGGRFVILIDFGLVPPQYGLWHIFAVL
jgi:hypothetical protein